MKIDQDVTNSVILALLLVLIGALLIVSEARVSKYKEIACVALGGSFVDGDCWPGDEE